MMKTNMIPPALIEEIQIATNDIYRYERFDRFAILNVLKAIEDNDNVEDVFIEQAKLALKHHPVKKTYMRSELFKHCSGLN